MGSDKLVDLIDRNRQNFFEDMAGGALIIMTLVLALTITVVCTSLIIELASRKHFLLYSIIFPFVVFFLKTLGKFTRINSK